MIQTPMNKYLETTVRTATPAQLLIMLVDGAIRFSKLGVEALRQNKVEAAHNNFRRAQDIIEEFIVTLDRSSSLADNLLRLYEYFNSRLAEANMKKEAAPAEEVIGYLQELKETWIQAAKSGTGAIKHG